jgi:hypothetical protein
MFLTEEEREVLKRVLERLLTPAAGSVQAKASLTIREQRELRKAAENGQKKS